jgi:integrase
MASLQSRHSRACALYQWTPFARATREHGCTCTPLHHVVLRRGGKLIREPVGHGRKVAQRALDSRKGEIADRRFRVLKDIRFDAWAAQWLESLTAKENTWRVYKTSLDLASAVFGSVKVRDLEVADIRRFLEHNASEFKRRHANSKSDEVRRSEIKPGTQAKHLRQLSACLEDAVREGYANDNPVRRLGKSLRPKVAKSKPSYYTDGELTRLWPELAARPVYAYLHKLAVVTGLRFGELAALEWNDVDFLNGELHVSKAYTAGIGVVLLPKDNESRIVDLTPQAQALLEDWYRQSGGGEGLVFEKETGGHLDHNYNRKHVLYPAMERAGIPRVGERGRKRDFHSCRHTFARIALEHGAEITWVQRQLGHSSITMTVDLYGHWARAAEKQQAAKLEGAFAL